MRRSGDRKVLISKAPLRFRVAVPCMLALVAGCGVRATTDFPNALKGPDGQVIVLEDIEQIVSDSDLSDEQKRAALHDLGLRDETLIAALLSL